MNTMSHKPPEAGGLGRQVVLFGRAVEAVEGVGNVSRVGDGEQL
jgi:hypothetical protein